MSYVEMAKEADEARSKWPSNPHPVVMAGVGNRDFGDNLKVETDLVLADYFIYERQVKELVEDRLPAYQHDDIQNPVRRAMRLLFTMIEAQVPRVEGVLDMKGIKFHLQLRSADPLTKSRLVVVLMRAWHLHHSNDPFFSSEFRVLLTDK